MWKPIDTAPKDGVILAWGEKQGCVVVEYDEGLTFPWCTLGGASYQRDAFTHWMPLPATPDET